MSRCADFRRSSARTTSHQLLADPNAFRELGVAGLLDRADVNEDASSPDFWLVKPYLLDHFTVPMPLHYFQTEVPRSNRRTA